MARRLGTVGLFAAVSVLVLIGRVWVASAEPPAGPRAAPPDVAVLALLGDGDDPALVRLAGEVQTALAQGGEAQVLPVAALVELLSGGGRLQRSGADLERLRGLFQQGYLQSYSFEYDRALTTLHRVLQGLDRLAPSAERWRLWTRTRIFQGIALAGLKQEDAALKSFAAVLRVRPKLALSRKEYAPGTIRLWEKARARLASLPRGRLAVETEPAGASVRVDGQALGRTPFIGELPYGHYHLHLVHPEAGDASRWVSIGAEPVRIRLQLSFEGALELDRAHPCIRLPAGQQDLPGHWWPWLGARLGLDRLVVVKRIHQPGQSRLVAALVDLERGRKLREGWLEPSGDDPAQRRQDASDLARFLLTGQAPDRLQVRPLSVDEPGEPVPPIGSRVPDLPVHYAPRPWLRTWWPYAVAGGLLLGGGLGCHLASDHYARQVDGLTTDKARKRAKDLSGSWFAAAMTGYALAGAAVVTGLVLHLTYEPVEVFPGIDVAPTVSAGGGGLTLSVRF